MLLKSATNILILCTVACIVGIGVLQFQWLKRSFEQEQLRLANEVHNAVKATADKVDYLNIKELVNESGLKESPRLFIREYPNASEVADSNFVIQVESIVHADTMFNGFIKDSLIESNMQIITTNSTEDVKVEVKQDRFNDFSEFIVEMIQSEKDGLDKMAKVQKLNLDSIFESELIARDLQLDYELTVSPAFINEGYSSELFPNLKVGLPLWINVGIEDEQSQVFKALLFPIILSISLSIVLLFTIVFGIRTFRKQKRISQMKTDFMNNMTHELKTPLANIGLAVDSINVLNDEQRIEKIKNLTSVIQRENKRMASHVDQVLEFARLEEGDLRLELTHFEPSSLIKEECDLFHQRLTDKDQFSFKLVGIKSIQADALHLSGSIRNLLDNAYKFSPDPKKISLEVEEDSDNWKLHVHDNGVGMSTSQVNNAFDRFFRAESSDSPTTKGFGLGLSYVKTVIEKMNGTVTIQSQLGKGTTATIQLPVA
ncbi:MAG: HAMP domain-containing sensor histidine kinase [Bacteroidota bacterium]